MIKVAVGVPLQHANTMMDSSKALLGTLMIDVLVLSCKQGWEIVKNKKFLQ
jgi:hypothetical protein